MSETATDAAHSAPPAPEPAAVSSSPDTPPAAEPSAGTGRGDVADRATSASRPGTEAPSPLAEATFEPPPFPGPRSESDAAARVLAEAATPPAPHPSSGSSTPSGQALYGADTSALLDHAGELSAASTITSEYPATRAVAEATYTPPPVREPTAPNVGRRENATTSIDSTTAAGMDADAGAHSGVGLSDGTVGDAEPASSLAADTTASTGSDAPTGSEPTPDSADQVRTTDPDAGEAQPFDPGPRDTTGHDVPTPVDDVAPEADTASPDPSPLGPAADVATHHVQDNAAIPLGTVNPAVEGTEAASQRAALSDAPAAGAAVGDLNATSAPGGVEADPTRQPDSAVSSADVSQTAVAPSQPDSEQTNPGSPGSADDQHIDDTSPASQDSGDTDTVQRYKPEDLGAFVAYGTETNHALYEGPDGLLHAVGDEIGRGLRRDKAGRLRDTTKYVSDDNKLAANDIDAHAVPGSPLDRMPVPATPYQVTQREALGAAALDRADKAALKADVWAGQVEPLAERLAEAGLTVDRNTFGSKKFMDRFGDAVEQGIPRDLRVATVAAAKNYQQASANLVEASEALGTAGGSFAVSLFYPDGQTITSSDGIRGSPDTFDRTVYDQARTPTLIIIEEKGAGSTLGVRIVGDPNNPGQRIKSQQNSPEYVHDLLEKDATLAAALHSDPHLYEAVRSTIAGDNCGTVECVLVHTSAEGAVSVTPYILDADRFRRDTIQLPPGEGTA